jgi:hypothetical protein
MRFPDLGLLTSHHGKVGSGRQGRRQNVWKRDPPQQRSGAGCIREGVDEGIDVMLMQAFDSSPAVSTSRSGSNTAHSLST